MYAVINGSRLFFDITGLQYEADGPQVKEKPVCLVFHGGPGSSHLHYLPSILKLSQTMQLIFIDDRNCGKSERGDLSTSTLKQNAADGEALRKYLGLDKVFVLGQSYGGMKVQRFTIDYPESIYGAIVVCSSPSHRFHDTAEEVVKRRGTPEQLQTYRDTFKGESKLELLEFLGIMDNLYHYRYNDEIKQEVINSNLRGEGWASSELCQYQLFGELKSFDLIPELKNVKVPMLILGGKEDFITAPVHSEEIHEAVKGSELHIVENCSHEIWDDRPDYIFPTIIEFVERNYKK